MQELDDAAARLTPEAAELLVSMSEAHRGATGDRLFLELGSLAGTSLELVGSDTRWGVPEVDVGALKDLVAMGLLHGDLSERGTPNYRLAGDGLRVAEVLNRRDRLTTAPGPSLPIAEIVRIENVSQPSPVDVAHVLTAAERLLGAVTQHLDAGALNLPGFRRGSGY